jgi:hypothetical protein
MSEYREKLLSELSRLREKYPSSFNIPKNIPDDVSEDELACAILEYIALANCINQLRANILYFNT